MDYEIWYNSLSLKDKFQEKRNLEIIIENNSFSKTAKQMAKRKLSYIKQVKMMSIINKNSIFDDINQQY